MLHSVDGGASWRGADGFSAAPSRSTWSFPAPPHLPHVLSLEFLPPCEPSDDSAEHTEHAKHGRGINTSESGAQSRPPVVVAGVEVGGVLRSDDGGDSWTESNSGLYPDVHSCRIDPHNPRLWFVATGGGLYCSENAGKGWKQVTQGMRGAQRYPVGLCFNPLQPGEILVTAGDRPPAIGVHVLRSVDGANFEDITHTVYGGACAEVSEPSVS